MALEKLRNLRRHLFWNRLAPVLNQRLIMAVSNRYYDKFASQEVRRHWARRIELVLGSPDNAHIRRVPEAGQVRRGYQVMHNGQEVIAGGYCGWDLLRMLQLNRGVHEPQEERAFQDVLPYIPAGATMLELGAYWCFYSLWFQQQVKNARSILVEPSPVSMAVGKHNFKHNKLQAEFIRAYVGRTPGLSFDHTPATTVDEILKTRNIQTLHILHADIQGAELDMLAGCEESFKNKRIQFIFISTHSNQLHDTCEARLRELGFEILASVDLDDSYSEDGVLVAKLPGIAGPGAFNLSRRKMESSAQAV